MLAGKPLTRRGFGACETSARIAFLPDMGTAAASRLQFGAFELDLATGNVLWGPVVISNDGYAASLAYDTAAVIRAIYENHVFPNPDWLAAKYSEP